MKWIEEDVPKGPATLPKTGGIPAGLLYGFGGLLATAGIALRTFGKKK